MYNTFIIYKNKLKNNLNLLKKHIFKYPTPTNLTYAWNKGFLLLIFLLIQILTGLFLSFYYCPNIDTAFDSIQFIMRDINYGWLIRYLHSNGASFFFLFVYMHMGRNIYYQRFDYFNWKVWVSGIMIFLLMIITAFIGYVLPWGQMSLWGSTVITNLLSAIPFAGKYLVNWIWGGYSIDGPTLSRFFGIHFILPFLILTLSCLHIIFLHTKGSSNPSYISNTINKTYLELYPKFAIKDFLGLFIILFIFLFVVFFHPNLLNHPDNYIEANPMLTPAHIVPEWYFLPFYAILRSVDGKLEGILAMIISILIFLILPYFSYLINKLGTDFKFLPTFNYYIYPIICFFFLVHFYYWVD